MKSNSESKRVKRLRHQIIKSIPRVPNNRESLYSLQKKLLPDLFVIYFNWKIRFIAQRRRVVVIEDSVKRDNRWYLLEGRIEAFLKKVSNGDDLTPHLSLKVHSRGYSLAADTYKSNPNAWEDKDFLLNVMRYHHFHLGDILPGKQHVDRSNDVLFAEVSRDTFTVKAILDHSVFDELDNTSGKMTMTKDKKRLYEISDERTTRGLPPGRYIIRNGISGSGHSIATVEAAIEYVKIIKEIDPKLDDIHFLRSLYDAKGLEMPRKPKLNWYLKHLDLGISDEVSGLSKVIKDGPT